MKKKTVFVGIHIVVRLKNSETINVFEAYKLNVRYLHVHR